MLPSNYFHDPKNLEEIKALILNTSISMKEIQAKYGFSRQRLYQIISHYNLPTKYKTRRNKFKEKYGNSPILYQLKHSLNERKRYNKSLDNNATIDDLLSEGSLPTYCPVLGIKLDYTTVGARNDNTASIDKIDNTKGYNKGNVAIISWRASRVKNDGNIEEHQKIVTFMKEKLKT